MRSFLHHKDVESPGRTLQPVIAPGWSVWELVRFDPSGRSCRRVFPWFGHI